MRVENMPVSHHMQQKATSQDKVTPQPLPIQTGMKLPNDVMKVNDEVIHHTIDVSTAIDKINDFIEPLHTDLKFLLHEKLNEYYVAVVNPMTDEVIKEIPPKKMLDMYAEMAQLMGILIDKKI